MIGQLAYRAQAFMDILRPLVDQPVIRYPHTFSSRTALVMPAGATGVAWVQTDFQNSLEWPFEIERIKPTQDVAHSAQDWRIGISDQVFAQQWFQTQTQLVAGLIDNNTGTWLLKFPYTVRPKGGAFTLTGDNLDTVNPISVNCDFTGYLLIPRT